MKPIKLSLTAEQVKALLRILRNQLFQAKYLDPRFPGHKSQPGELEVAESAVRTLEAALRDDQLRSPSSFDVPIHR